MSFANEQSVESRQAHLRAPLKPCLSNCLTSAFWRGVRSSRKHVTSYPELPTTYTTYPLLPHSTASCSYTSSNPAAASFDDGLVDAAVAAGVAAAEADAAEIPPMLRGTTNVPSISERLSHSKSVPNTQTERTGLIFHAVTFLNADGFESRALACVPGRLRHRPPRSPSGLAIRCCRSS